MELKKERVQILRVKSEATNQTPFATERVT